MSALKLAFGGILCTGLIGAWGCQTRGTDDLNSVSGESAVHEPGLHEIALGSGEVEFAIEADSYTQAFSVSREVLLEYRFNVNRVDAARGVLTTHPKRTVGLVSPWDQEQTTLDQELEEFVNQHERVVRLEFDHDSESQGVQVRVQVQVYRVHRPHRRVETESIRRSTYARSRDEFGRTTADSFRELIGLDEMLARRIGHDIQNRI